jgi:hypothetical protein
MRAIVCGGRSFHDIDFVNRKLTTMHKMNPFTEIITGGAFGADTCANQWAFGHRVKRTKVYAEWRKFGNKAGPIRNRAMLDMGPDIVIAFPGGAGTKHMMKIAREAGINVIYFDPENESETE